MEKLEKNIIFKFSVSEMSFTTTKNLIYIFGISALLTQTLIQSQIDLGFHCFYLEITWKIHEILCHQRSGNPVATKTSYVTMFLAGYLLSVMFGLAECLTTCQLEEVSLYCVFAHASQQLGRAKWPNHLQAHDAQSHKI